MTLNALIQDGEGSKRTVGITKEHAIKTSPIQISLNDLNDSGNLDILTRTKVFSETFKDSVGSDDLIVDGSSTPVEFSINAENDKAISVYYVKMIFYSKKFAMENETEDFGDDYDDGLINGIDFFVEQGGVETNIFFQPLKRLVDFFHYSEELVSVKDALPDGVDLLMVKIGFVQPINIVPGVTDRLVIRINDDLTGMYSGIANAFGTKEFL